MSPHVHAASRPDVANCRNPQVLSSGRKGLVISREMRVLTRLFTTAPESCSGESNMLARGKKKRNFKRDCQTKQDRSRSSIRHKVCGVTFRVLPFSSGLFGKLWYSIKAARPINVHVLYCTCTSCTVQHVYTKNEFFSDSRSLFLARLLADVHMFCPDGLELSFCVI